MRNPPTASSGPRKDASCWSPGSRTGPASDGHACSRTTTYTGCGHSARSHSQGYLIGYATSPDGLHWDRKDEAGGLPKSASGWDSEMTCFASVVDTPAGRFMFYNGNDFGRTGVGVARFDAG